MSTTTVESLKAAIARAELRERLRDALDEKAHSRCLDDDDDLEAVLDVVMGVVGEVTS